MWQSFLGAFLLVVAISVDLFVCAFAYGTSKQCIDFRKTLLLNIVGTFVIGLGLAIGALLGEIIPKDVTLWLSFCILMLLGFVKLANYSREEDKTKHLSLRQTIVLALALSVDGFAAGVGTAAHKPDLVFCVSAVALSLLNGVFIFLLGQKLGQKVAQKTSLNLGWSSGIILIILAFCKLFF